MDVSATPHNAAKVSQRRWLPRMRFSLRTLVLTVLLIGSGGTLWWNWGPWAVAFRIAVPDERCSVMFNRDETLLAVFSRPHNTKGGKTNLVVYESLTGKVVSRYSSFEHSGRSVLLGEWACIYDDPGLAFGDPLLKPDNYVFVELKTGKEILPKNNQLIITDQSLFGTNYVSNWNPFAADSEVIKLPDLTVAREGMLTPDDKVIQGTETLTIKDLHSGQSVKTEAMVGIEYWRNIYSGPRAICGELHTVNRDEAYTCIFDSASGKLLLKVAGELVGHADDCRSVLTRVNDTPTIKLYRAGSNGEVLSFQSVTNDIYFLHGTQLIFDDSVLGQMFDASTSKKLWERGEDNTRLQMTANGHFLASEMHADPFSGQGNDFNQVLQVHIVDAYTGKKLMRIATHFEWPDNDYKLVFGKDTPQFAYTYKSLNRVTGEENNHILVYQLSRPLSWYGPAWLPEFWLTSLLGITFVWSLFRDRRTA